MRPARLAAAPRPARLLRAVRAVLLRSGGGAHSLRSREPDESVSTSRKRVSDVSWCASSSIGRSFRCDARLYVCTSPLSNATVVPATSSTAVTVQLPCLSALGGSGGGWGERAGGGGRRSEERRPRCAGRAGRCARSGGTGGAAGAAGEAGLGGAGGGAEGGAGWMGGRAYRGSSAGRSRTPCSARRSGPAGRPPPPACAPTRPTPRSSAARVPRAHPRPPFPRPPDADDRLRR